MCVEIIRTYLFILTSIKVTLEKKQLINVHKKSLFVIGL